MEGGAISGQPPLVSGPIEEAVGGSLHHILDVDVPPSLASDSFSYWPYSIVSFLFSPPSGKCPAPPLLAAFFFSRYRWFFQEA